MIGYATSKCISNQNYNLNYYYLIDSYIATIITILLSFAFTHMKFLYS